MNFTKEFLKLSIYISNDIKFNMVKDISNDIKLNMVKVFQQEIRCTRNLLMVCIISL